MKRSEVKIGDIVSYNGTVAPIYDLARDVVRFDEGSVSALIKDISPVPLTEEILEKDGWRENDEIWGIDNAFGQLHIEFFSNGKEIEAMVSVTDNRDVCCLKQIKHIHQLQHILWALGMDDDLKI